MKQSQAKPALEGLPEDEVTCKSCHTQRDALAASECRWVQVWQGQADAALVWLHQAQDQERKAVRARPLAFLLVSMPIVNNRDQ